MAMVSVIPGNYDPAFIFAKAGVANHYGYDEQEDRTYKLGYRVEDGEAVVAAIESFPVDYLEVALPLKLAEISAERDVRIRNFSFNGFHIELDDETKANLTGAALGLMRNTSVESLDWSLGGGQFLNLPRDFVFALADAAFMHVQNTFTAHKMLCSMAEAAMNIEALTAINVTSDTYWP